MQQFITSAGIFLKGSVDRRPSLRARDWNTRIAAPCQAAVLLPGASSTVIRTPRGQTLNLDPSAGWLHPWFVSGSWKADGFYIRIRPGFVNGIAPKVDDEKTLLDGPEIKIHGWRAVTSDVEPIPAFFRNLGVRKTKASGISISDIGGITIDATERDENLPPPRLLCAADIWVSVARATYELRADIPANLVTGQLVEYSVGFNTQTLEAVGAAPRLQQGPRFQPNRTPSLQDRLAGVFQDDGEDRILISTLYMLSPENAQEHRPTPQWQFFRSNNAFWNLAHAAKNSPPKTLKQSPTDPFLSAFIGRYTVVPQATMGALDAEIQRIMAAVLNTTANEGRFWTV